MWPTYVYRIVFGKREEIGRRRSGSEDNIKTDHEGNVCMCVCVGGGGCGVRARTSCFEHGKEASGFVEDKKYLDYLSDCQLLKKDAATWN